MKRSTLPRRGNLDNALGNEKNVQASVQSAAGDDCRRSSQRSEAAGRRELRDAPTGSAFTVWRRKEFIRRTRAILPTPRLAQADASVVAAQAQVNQAKSQLEQVKAQLLQAHAQAGSRARFAGSGDYQPQLFDDCFARSTASVISRSITVGQSVAAR